MKTHACFREVLKTDPKSAQLGQDIRQLFPCKKLFGHNSNLCAKKFGPYLPLKSAQPSKACCAEFFSHFLFRDRMCPSGSQLRFNFFFGFVERVRFLSRKKVQSLLNILF